MCDWTIREAVKEDSATVIQLLQDMIAYHNMSHKYDGVSLEEFMQDCFGEDPWCYCIVVEKEQPQDGHSSQNTKKHLIGYSIYHHTYKAYLGKGLYLIDLFVIPSERSKGIGKAMFEEIAKIGVRKGCSVVNWDIAGWNKRAISFYEGLGAKMCYQFTFMSISGDAMYKLSNDNNETF